MAAYLSNILLGLIVLFYVILIVLSLRTDHRKDGGFVIFLFFLVFLLAATIVQLLFGLNILKFFSAQTQSRFPLYLGFIISIFLSGITTSFLNSKPLKWYWWGFTVLWFAGSVLINENFNRAVLDHIQLDSFIIPLSTIGTASLIVGWGLFSLRSIRDTLIIFHQTVHPLHQNRYLFWLASVLVSMAGVLLSIVIKFPTSLGEAVVMFATVMMGTIYLRHDLPDVRQVVKSWLSICISILLSIGIYTAFFFLIQSYFRWTQLNIESFILVLLIAAILTLLVNPLLKFVQQLIARFILESVDDPNRLISEYSKKISNIIDLGHLTIPSPKIG